MEVTIVECPENVSLGTLTIEYIERFLNDHVTAFHEKFGRLPPYNHIQLFSDRIRCSRRLPGRVACPIDGTLLFYDSVSPDADTLQIPFAEIEGKSYLYGGVDACTWRGRRCVMKRIDFTPDLAKIQREIEVREKLRAHLSCSGGELSEFEATYNLAPMLGVVMFRPDSATAVGLLMPHCGENLLRQLQEDDPDAHQGRPCIRRHACRRPTGPTARVLDLSERTMHDFAAGVRRIRRAGAEHGAVGPGNIVLSADSSRLVLVSCGRKPGRRYKGDVRAAGTTLLWMLQHVPWVRTNRAASTRIIRLAAYFYRDMDRFERELNDDEWLGSALAREMEAAPQETMADQCIPTEGGDGDR